MSNQVGDAVSDEFERSPITQRSLLNPTEGEMQIASGMAVMVTIYWFVFFCLQSTVRAAERRRDELVPILIRDTNSQRAR